MTSARRQIVNKPQAAFTVAKVNKRLWIVEGDRPVYTPPDFVKLGSREPLKALAQIFNETGAYDVDAVAGFESRHSTRKAVDVPETDALSLRR